MAKRGPKAKDNLPEIWHLMTLIADGMSVKPAAKMADPKNPGGLRAKYYRLKREGRLPIEPPLRKSVERSARASARDYRLHFAALRERLGSAEEKARSYGYDPDSPDLAAQESDMRRELEEIEAVFKSGDPLARAWQSEDETPEDVLARFEGMAARQDQLRRECPPLAEIVECRRRLGNRR